MKFRISLDKLDILCHGQKSDAKTFSKITSSRITQAVNPCYNT